MKNLTAFLSLILIGLIVHYPSLKMAVYGDDWLDIYYFYTQSYPENLMNHWPGILAYIAPYGFGVFWIGNLYNIFGTQYFVYFLISLLFKIFASFCLFLLGRYLGQLFLGKDTILSFLIACFYLVSLTAMQTTDWTQYMGIYLASGFYLLSVLYQIKFIRTGIWKFGSLNIFFALVSLLVGVVRFTPLVATIPFLDFLMVFAQTGKAQYRQVLLKNIIFGIWVIVLWGLGLFGSPMKIYSPGLYTLNDFLTAFWSNSPGALINFISWVGILIIPNNFFTNKLWFLGIGVVFVVVNLFFAKDIFLKLKLAGKMLSIFGLNILFFLFSIWYFTPLQTISSDHRYLLAIFVCFCIWLSIFGSLGGIFFRRVFGFILVWLICVHIFSVHKIYSVLLAAGRGSDFINYIDSQIMKDFQSPIEQPNIIYVDIDRADVKQSVIFGLGFKIMVLSHTSNQKYFPLIYDDKKEIVKLLKKAGLQKEQAVNLISSLHAYKIRDKMIENISKNTKLEINRAFSLP